MADNRVTVRIGTGWAIGIGVWWFVWGAKGFWWGVLYGTFWPVWVGYRLADALLEWK
jgi:hypothetical protein